MSLQSRSLGNRGSVAIEVIAIESLAMSPATSTHTKALFSWWPTVRAARDQLPWRSTKDPWLTLMAEFMLAQTQTIRVVDRFVEMAERFPTPASCADAAQREVVACWVGLGYNRRAVALHQSAQAIVDRHGGVVPKDLDALLALPGVGPYTARAILAFAFDDHVGVVDTNIGRVLSRAVAGSPLKVAEAQRLADRLVPAVDHGSGILRSWTLEISSVRRKTHAVRIAYLPTGCVAGGQSAAALGNPS